MPTTKQQQQQETKITTTQQQEDQTTTSREIHPYFTTLEAAKTLKSNMKPPAKTRVQSMKANFKTYKHNKINITKLNEPIRTIDTYFQRGTTQKLIGQEIEHNTIIGLR